MKVHIKLHATLRKYVPAGAQGDTVVVEMPDGATVSDVLAQLHIPPEHARMIVSRNAQLEPGATLEDGQEVNLFPPLAGGVGLLGGTPHLWQGAQARPPARQMDPSPPPSPRTSAGRGRMPPVSRAATCGEGSGALARRGIAGARHVPRSR